MMTKNTDILDRIGYHLRAARGGSGVTDEAAGQQLGFSGASVGRWLLRPEDLKLCRILDLLQVYGVDPGEILTRAIADAQVGKARELEDDRGEA